MATSQGISRAARAGKIKEGFSLRAFGEVWPCQHLDFQLLYSKTGIINLFFQICGNLVQHPQGTDNGGHSLLFAKVVGKPARVFAVSQLKGTADAFLGRCFLQGTQSHGKRCGKGSIYRSFTAALCLLTTKQRRMGKSMRCCNPLVPGHLNFSIQLGKQKQESERKAEVLKALLFCYKQCLQFFL